MRCRCPESAGPARGRWNSIGTRLAYAAGSASLALLEMLAHVDRRTVPMMDRRLLEFDVPDDAIRTPERYPDGPDQLPHAPGMRAVGDAGIKSAASLSLPVPGAIVHGESNVRINPTHPRFAEIRLSSNRALVLDSRLFDR